MDSCSPRCRRESQTSETSAANAFVVFNDPAFGPNGSHYLDTVLQARHRSTPAVIGETPVNFNSIYVQNKSRLDGVEALYIYRPSELPLGGTLEFTAGGRYFELKDQFWVDARGGNLTDSYWNTTSHNEIAGPEIGVRWFQPYRAVRHFGRGPLHGGHQCPVGQPGRPLGRRIDPARIHRPPGEQRVTPQFRR